MTIARINSYLISYARKNKTTAISVSERLYYKLLTPRAYSVYIPFRDRETGLLDYIRVYPHGDY